ncbi:hypothetical protein RHSIM_Rhsim10G0074900 [Rhododendron simsii]|uniref:Uncharacterized protein n=1 Tax=Rhododendron simsii TaxID=118357 RepID=A0A834GFW0_RHOSS|nr:hypothetical protein RHSIM_Rhsim10G0074900 [Rhododendron simsii]
MGATRKRYCNKVTTTIGPAMAVTFFSSSTNAFGRKGGCALAIRGPTYRITYTAFGAFLDEYHHILPLGGVVHWRFSSMFAQWLDGLGLLYHSFLLCSDEVIISSVLITSNAGIRNAWHLNYVVPAGSAQKLPKGLCSYFPADGASTWIMLRHGFRAWPVEECEARLNEVFHIFDLEDMVIHMADRPLEIAIQDLKLDVPEFDQFWAAINMELLDYLLIIMLPNAEFQQ